MVITGYEAMIIWCGTFVDCFSYVSSVWKDGLHA